MITTLKYLSVLGIVLALVLTFGVTTSRAFDNNDFGAVRVDKDVVTLHQPGPNEFGYDWATNNASGPQRDADIAAKPMPRFTWGLGICGTMSGSCRRGN
jgi:hypothetical protein